MNRKKDTLMLDMRTALLVCALLVSAGCAVGPDYRSPDKKMPSAWTGMDNATARQPSAAVARPLAYIAWWRAFHDPALNSLVEQALAANLDLKIAESRVRQARAARTIAAAALWPQLDASGSYTRSHQGQQSSESSNTGAAANALICFRQALTPPGSLISSAARAEALKPPPRISRLRMRTAAM
jgi:outer membrane protein TolC